MNKKFLGILCLLPLSIIVLSILFYICILAGWWPILLGFGIFGCVILFVRGVLILEDN